VREADWFYPDGFGGEVETTLKRSLCGMSDPGRRVSGVEVDQNDCPLRKTLDSTWFSDIFIGLRWKLGGTNPNFTFRGRRILVRMYRDHLGL